jgi:hypothetical protein
VNSILQVLDQVSPSSVCCRWRRPRHRGRWGIVVHQTVPRVALRAGTSSQALVRTPNARVRVLQRPPSPSPNPLAYWPMEPSNDHRSERSPGAPLRHPRLGPLPLPSCSKVDDAFITESKGGREGVDVAKEDDEEEPVEVIPVLDSHQGRHQDRR